MSERQQRNPSAAENDQSIRSLRLGVVSDTHGHVHYALDAVRMLENLEIDAVVHCGDIGSPEIVPLFKSWPTHFVFGNVDFPEAPLQRAIERAGQQCHGRFADLMLGGRRVAVLHGDDSAALDSAIASQQYALVCHGHTHQARQRRQGDTLLLNPGALYRATPHSFAIVEFPAIQATIIPIP